MFKFLKRKKYQPGHLSEDILVQIELDFKEYRANAIELLNAALKEDDCLRGERIVRCIIFLANGDLGQLTLSIEDAKGDPRDVMYWAEYLNRDSLGSATRVRDFNKPFNENNLSKRE